MTIWLGYSPLEDAFALDKVVAHLTEVRSPIATVFYKPRRVIVNLVK